jgi:CRISPR-associated exonuclease Cas4
MGCGDESLFKHTRRDSQSRVPGGSHVYRDNEPAYNRLVLIALTLIVLALLLFVLSRRLRKQTGLPQGRVIYSDAGAWQRNDRSLFSAQHQLAGKPDYLVRTAKGIVPVEVKSSPAPPQPRPGHVLQLAAYCLLVEEQLGEHVPHGIIQYTDRQFAIDYTPALRAELLRVMDEMRVALADGNAHRSHADPRRCAACGVRDACEERLGA